MKVHMSLPAKKLKETLEFYSIVFGEEPVKVKEDYIKFDPSSVPLNISFHAVSDDSQVNVSQHLGFQLENDRQMEEIYKRLQEAGYIQVEKNQEVCCYAKQDKFWVQDPTGFKWEFYILLEDTEEKASSKLTCCAGGEVETQSKCC